MMKDQCTETHAVESKNFEFYTSGFVKNHQL